MEVVVTAGAIGRARLQSNHYHQQTNTKSCYRPDVLPVAQPTMSKHWREKYHIPWTCLPQAHLGVFQICLWPLIAPGYLEGGLPCLSSALWCQYPTFIDLRWVFSSKLQARYSYKKTLQSCKSSCLFWHDNFNVILSELCWNIKYTKLSPSRKHTRLCMCVCMC